MKTVLVVYSISEVEDEPVHIHSLARAYNVCLYTV